MPALGGMADVCARRGQLILVEQLVVDLEPRSLPDGRGGEADSQCVHQMGCGQPEDRVAFVAVFALLVLRRFGQYPGQWSLALEDPAHELPGIAVAGLVAPLLEVIARSDLQVFQLDLAHQRRPVVDAPDLPADIDEVTHGLAGLGLGAVGHTGLLVQEHEHH